ncbi:MAG: coenzyme F420-reducing hydrogenase, FrhD protein [Methanomicrobiaceae archaeon]|nr:coenzyme F420-reducing hydrogenase, FrhD protein [Methanomicrobiaceae archaeon]
MLYPEIVIAGCGNPLFADDGFGPAVIEELNALQLPENVKAVDAGLGGPHFIFTLLDPDVTKKLIILDIAEFGEVPGSLVRLSVDDLPQGSYRDAHSWDLMEPLQRLKDSMEIIILGCQPKHVSAPDMEIGITEEVLMAIPKAVQFVLREIGVENGTAIKTQEDHSGRAAGERGIQKTDRKTGGKIGTC